MDNDPGHFEAFQRVRYVTSNITSQKQPCNLGVIAAVKKRYKFLLLKYVLPFNLLDNDNKQLVKEDSKFRRGSVANLQHAAKSMLKRKEWDKATDEIIKNAFIKTYLKIV